MNLIDRPISNRDVLDYCCILTNTGANMMAILLIVILFTSDCLTNSNRNPTNT